MLPAKGGLRCMADRGREGLQALALAQALYRPAHIASCMLLTQMSRANVW